MCNSSDAPQASSDHTARLWEMASGETVRQYNGHHKGLFRVFSEEFYPVVKAKTHQPRSAVRCTTELAEEWSGVEGRYEQRKNMSYTVACYLSENAGPARWPKIRADPD
jgi:hypothetical protein